jgi:hypothetical protein
MSASSVRNVALPLMRSVSSTPGIMNNSPTPGRSTRFCIESRRLLPGESGMSTVCSSKTFTKPGSPPRGEASTRPSASVLAITRNGDSETNRRQCASSRSSCLRSERSEGSR